MSAFKARDDFKISIPTWAAALYICSSLVLLPWTIYLGTSLPTRHLSTHWDISWTGLDIAIIVTMITTGILARMKSRWVAITASSLASLLLTDAWFDVMSERQAAQFYQALLSAGVLEVPIAIASYYLAYRVLKYKS